MYKKGELSINIIIVAIIALIVLVVMAAIFTGRMSLFGIGLDKASTGNVCDSDGMKMMTSSQCSEQEGKVVYGNFRTCDSKKGESPSSGCYLPGYVCCNTE